MNDSQFALNPIVTLNHCYHMPPAGRSLWRKKVSTREGGRGVKAKTVFPAKPENWPEGEQWVPDVCFGLIQQQLLNGKSIGFPPLKVREPNDDEREQFGRKADTIVEEWMLLEYACVYLPAQQNAVVEEVSKTVPGEVTKSLAGLTESELAGFTSWSEIQKTLSARLAEMDFPEVAKRLMAEAIATVQGKIE